MACHVTLKVRTARDLSCGLKAVAARFARAANRVFGRTGPVLDGRAHVRVLRTPRQVRHAIAYVLLNAHRQAAQAGRRVRDWAARIDPASSRPLVRRRLADAVAARARRAGGGGPHTRLLAVGWRRHGLIDPGAVPGGAR